MSCSNCFNGCAEIVSDKCVKYTGTDIPALGISYGDTLLYVEEQLAKFIISTLDGTGIVIDVPPSVICDLIKKHLPSCPSYQLDELIITIIKAVCDLQTQVDVIKADITALNGDYTIGCLTGVSPSSDTHQIVQAIITRLCAIDSSLASLIIDVNTNYVKIDDIDIYIAKYLATIAPANKAYTKMVPYSPIPYYGALSGYPTPSDSLSTLGQGTGYWEKVYICNGLNSTPDLRGRVIVGAISGLGGSPLQAAVDPSNPFNPNYAVGTLAGSNSVTLTASELPSHTHAATDAGHVHVVTVQGTTSGSNAPNGAANYPTFNSTTDLGGNAFTTPLPGMFTAVASGQANIVVANTGGGQPHPNNQPAMGMCYIIYIP
jgi:microcystin-dependent protein